MSVTLAATAMPAMPANPLLSGRILPTLVRLALPNVLAMAATVLVGIAEISYIGILGTEPLAAMALVFPFAMLAQMMSAGAMGGGVSSAVGVALGQLIATGISVAVLLWYLSSGRARFRLQFHAIEFRREMFFDILKVGALACLSPVQSILTVLIFTALVARFGVAALAGYGIGARLEFLLIPIAFGVGVAAVPMVGMAIGAGEVARARRVARTAGGLSALMLGLIGLVVAIAPELWAGLFSREQAVLLAANQYLRLAGP